jgi:hypothetical protein
MQGVHAVRLLDKHAPSLLPLGAPAIVLRRATRSWRAARCMSFTAAQRRRPAALSARVASRVTRSPLRRCRCRARRGRAILRLLLARARQLVQLQQQLRRALLVALRVKHTITTAVASASEHSSGRRGSERAASHERVRDAARGAPCAVRVQQWGTPRPARPPPAPRASVQLHDATPRRRSSSSSSRRRSSSSSSRRRSSRGPRRRRRRLRRPPARSSAAAPAAAAAAAVRRRARLLQLLPGHARHSGVEGAHRGLVRMLGEADVAWERSGGGASVTGGDAHICMPRPTHAAGLSATSATAAITSASSNP